MNKLRRTFVFILIMAFCLSLFSVASAHNAGNPGKPAKPGTDKNNKPAYTLSADLQTLKTLGLLVGTDSNGLTYDYTQSKPTRVQGFVIYLRLLALEQDSDRFDYRDGDDNFKDSKGCSPYVQKKMAYAKKHPELNWVGFNGYFNPMARLTAKEYALIMLTALGYKSNADFTWQSVESFASSLGLTIPKGDFTIEKLATMTVQTLYMTKNNSTQTLIDYLASQNADFAARVAQLENGGPAGSTPDTTKPTVTDVVLSRSYTAAPETSGQVTVYFSEAMKADTLKNLANYAADMDGALTAGDTAQLSAVAGAKAVAAADLKSVTLTIPGSTLKGGDAPGAGVTNLTVSGLSDTAGNTLDPVTQFVRASTVLTAQSYAAVEVNKLLVTFNNPLKTVKPTDFRLYRSDGVTLALVGTGYTLDATGKSLTIILGGNLTAAATDASDVSAAKLAIGTDTKDIFGNSVSGPVAVPIVGTSSPATVVIGDKIAPSAASVVKAAAPYTVDIAFNEPVNAVDLATLTAALIITNNAGTAQSTTFTVSGAAGTINDFTKLTVTIVGGTSGSYGVQLLGQGIRDAAGNIVKAYPKTTLSF